MKLAIVVLFVISTGTLGEESKNVQSVRLNQEFAIKIGEHVEVKAETLHLKFTSVPEDSRCPKGEQCITQGNARIELELSRNGNESDSVLLNTTSGSSETDYHGYAVQLISLNPYPVTNQRIRAEDYEAVLEVTLTKNREQ